MQFDMDQSLGFVLNKTALLSKARFNERIKQFGISPEQWSLIFRIVERPGLTQKELSDSTYKDQANITRSIERLEKNGFVQKVQGERDRRAFHLYPTQSALSVVEKIVPVSRAFNCHLTQGFTQEESDMFMKLLHKIHTNLESEETL